MEKFAIIAFPDDGYRFIRQNKILERLPKKIVELYACMRGPRLVDIVVDRNSEIELGYIYSIPSLYYDREQLIFNDRERQINLLIKELRANGIRILSAPFIEDLFNERDISCLNRNGITILDTNLYRLTTLYLCVPGLLKILNKQLPYMDVGIWGGDTALGEGWIYMLAPYFNRMTIGGKDVDKLYRLSSKVLQETGLSCEITDNMDYCIKGKDISISTVKADDNIDKGAISILSYPLDIHALSEPGEEFHFHSGLLELSCEAMVDIDLNAWEYLAVSNSLLYILHSGYRRLVDNDILNMSSIGAFLKAARLYPLKVRGFFNSHSTITYDRFRMLYFKENSTRVKVG